jgi:carboxyl-terminal processing protease
MGIFYTHLSVSLMSNQKKWLMPVMYAALIIAGMFIGAKLTPVNRMFNGAMSASIYNYNKIQDILFLLERDYVDKVDQNELVEMAIQGMLEQLDPHSVYISAAQIAAVNEEITGNFEGVGVQFAIRKDTIVVMNVVKGGPAEREGVLGGDRILEVDDQVVASTGVTNEDVFKLLKGPKGSQVKLKIYRPGRKTTISFTLARDVIRTNSVEVAYLLNQHTGYMKINTFSETTYSEFIQGMRQLTNAGMKKVILDLRGNGGGLLDQAIRITNEFLGPRDLIVYTMGKSGKKKTHYANGHGAYQDIGLVVLIDDFSASASEILAGAIQDQDRGVVVGRRSFGKGLVQQQVVLADGSALRVTTERYYTPSGRSIQKPYTHGQEDYYGELMERYSHGGMQTPDSTLLTDSLKFFTLRKKRTVYGGGGIMPDHFIPFHQKDETELYKQLSRSGIIYEFATDFADRNRTAITTQFDSVTFVQNYTPDAVTMKAFRAHAAKQGYPSEKPEAGATEAKLKLLIKAYIARSLFGEEPFYRIINQQDEAVKRAVSLKNEK